MRAVNVLWPCTSGYYIYLATITWLGGNQERQSIDHVPVAVQGSSRVAGAEARRALHLFARQTSPPADLIRRQQDIH